VKLLLDTNIVVDILSKREGCGDSLRILKLCEVGRAEGCVSAVTVTDITYILRKYVAPESVRDALLTLILIIDVTDVLKSDIKGAFSCGIKDFEDAVQSMCAKRIGADYIVTRNLKDFRDSPVRAISPAEALEILG
jgi:predicted nucleic acid-binding protein